MIPVCVPDVNSDAAASCIVSVLTPLIGVNPRAVVTSEEVKDTAPVLVLKEVTPPPLALPSIKRVVAPELFPI